MSLSIDVSRKPSPEIIDLVHSTVWGSEDGTQYIHRDTPDKIGNLINPYFLSLSKNTRLLGAIAFSNRIFNGSNIPGYYIRYFSFLKSLQSKGPIQNRKSGKNRIKESVKKFFSQGGFDDRNEKSIFYAYVELLNERSMRVCLDFGFHPIRKFGTTVFSRLNPKASGNISRIKEVDKKIVKDKLNNFYSSYTMYYNHRLFDDNNYFVVKENNEIIAGAQFTPVNWRIVNIPGISGKLMLNVLPKIPFVKEVFNPEDYRFLGIDHIYVAPGYEQKLNGLFESVLKIMDYRSALIWTDVGSKLHSIINSLNLGLLNKLKSDVPGEIIAYCSNLNEEEKKLYKSKPAYIATYDLT